MRKIKYAIWKIRWFIAKQLLRLTIVVNPGELPPYINPLLVKVALTPMGAPIEPIKTSTGFGYDDDAINEIISEMNRQREGRRVTSSIKGLLKDLDQGISTTHYDED